jgi:hypothetical protein
MSDKSKSNPLSRKKYDLSAILLFYAICALILGFVYRYAVNPDGISLLRLSGYIADGNFQQSVTSGWSPLMTWVIAPFVFFGFDGLTAARIAIGLCGAGLLLCGWLLSSRFNLSQNIKLTAGLISALLISVWSIYAITADVLVAALTLCYLYLVTDEDILINRKSVLLCGFSGGLSYLAHHYALPFFLAHFPTMLFLRGYLGKGETGIPLKKIFVSFGVGMAGFLIIALAWIGIVSAKYGHLSISSKGGVAHAVMGPKDKDRRHPFFVGGLYKPRDSYAMHVFEDPSEVEFNTWSPFESKEYFMHQLKVVKINAAYIINHFVNRSPFFTYAFVIGILVIIPIALLLNPLSSRNKFLYAWVIITFSIYSSGFLLLIARSPRRFYALMIAFILLSFHFLEELKSGMHNIMTSRKSKVLTYYLIMIIILAFSLKPGVHLLKSLRNIVAVDQINPYEEIAKQINKVEFPSPYAIIRSSQKPHTDMYIAFYLQGQLLGRPQSRDVDGISRELKKAWARSLLVFDNEEIVEQIKSDQRYIHIASRQLKDSQRYKRTVHINIRGHEIITGWDREVNIFALR